MSRRRLGRLASLTSSEIGWRSRTAVRASLQRVSCAIREPRWNRETVYGRLQPTPELAAARSALANANWAAAHDELQRHFATRRSLFILDSANRRTFSSALAVRYPEARRQAAQRGERLLTGARDVLGYHGLRFDGWHHDPVNRCYAPRVVWDRVPYLDPALGDHKVIWEVNRQQHWLSWGRAYWLTNDDRYREAFVNELAGWMNANPPLIGINWASMLELSFRSLSWIWALHFFARAEPRGDHTPWLVDLLMGLDAQLTHVERNLSYYFSPNTHLLGEALALYVAGQALPELTGSGRRAALGRHILIAEAGRQVLADGMHCERSTHYHRYALDFYLLALGVARASDDRIAAAFQRIVTRLATAARLLAGDDGRVPHIGDDDGGMLMPIAGRPADDWRDSLAAAATLTGRRDLLIGEPPEEAAWMTGELPPALSGATVDSETIASHALGGSGYYISRTHGKHHLVIDGGAHGYLNGGHAHADALAVTLSVRNRPLLIDPGTACYTIDNRRRDQFRSTLAHNTLQIDDRPQSTPAGPFHWSNQASSVVHRWRSTKGFDLFDGSHDGYAPLTHRRRVLTIHDELIVVADSVLGEGEHKADVHWHLSDCWSSRVHGRRVELSAAGERVRVVVPHGRVEAFRADPVTGLGWYSPAYGVVKPTTTLRLTHSGPAPFTIATVIDLNAADPVEEMEWLPVWSEAGRLTQSSAFKILRRDTTDYVLFAEPSDPAVHGHWRLGEFETDACVLYYRIGRRGKVSCLALADGSYVRSAGRRALALTLGRPAEALMVDEFTIGTYTPCAVSPGL